MNSRKKKIGLIFVALPFLAILLMIGINVYNLNAHKEYRIEIEGYDPRDLLKGHYLQFRYKWPVAEVAKRSAYACGCFSGNTKAPVVTFEGCPDKPTALPEHCKTFMKMMRNGDSYQPYQALRQFYIPEEHAQRLERMLREGQHTFEVGLVPRDEGAAQLKTLYIDGVDLDTYLKNNP